LAALAQTPDAALIRKLTGDISDITGWKVKREIPVTTVSRDGWKRWVDEEIRRTVKPAEIHADEQALRMFGLIPDDYDLRQATVALLGEQAAAIYDHRRRRMMIVEGGAESFGLQQVLVHELAHALADQHFDMHRFLDKSAKNDESQTARMAVVEGQAMWIMLEQQIRAIGGVSLLKSGAALDAMLPAMGNLASEAYPVFTGAPLYLKQTLLFPYTAGLKLQQAAVERSGVAGLAGLLENPPDSTRQVLHPAAYFAGEQPVKAELPAIENARQYESLSTGSLGELDVRILIDQYVSTAEADAVAPGWRGGAYEIMERKADRAPLLRWTLVWDSPESARRFLSTYARVVTGKWKTAEVTKAGVARLEGSGPRGGFCISVDGSTVRGVEGMKR